MDAPSGTAIELAEEMVQRAPDKDMEDIQIHSVERGTHQALTESSSAVWERGWRYPTMLMTGDATLPEPVMRLHLWRERERASILWKMW